MYGSLNDCYAYKNSVKSKKRDDLHTTYYSNKLDLTTLRKGYSVFPDMSGTDVMYTANYLKDEWRDKERNYIIDVERLQHPNHFSRYGYARGENGYRVGFIPGKYNLPSECIKDPEGMAPAIYYEKYP